MFGVTTPCVTGIVDHLKDDYDCLVFHATGTGGRTMEKLADSGLLAGVIDITTTEVCDFLFGGVLPATEDRFGAIARTTLPYVGSVGALDMVNFWAPETVPEQWKARLFYQHNPNVTLMRTTAEECHAIGEWIGKSSTPARGRCVSSFRKKVCRRWTSKAALSGIRMPTPRCSRRSRRRSARPTSVGSSACRCTSTTRNSPRPRSRLSARLHEPLRRQ